MKKVHGFDVVRLPNDMIRLDITGKSVKGAITVNQVGNKVVIGFSNHLTREYDEVAIQITKEVVNE